MQSQQEIKWRQWSNEVFEDAQREGKPILLSISATWCHWCHVLDEEGFTHPEVVRRINADFIPVRVDSDKRPDINSRYNMGGWPTVAILSPAGELMVGGTYMPTGQLLAMLADTKGDVSREIPHGRPRAERTRPDPPLCVEESWIQTVSGLLERVYDRHFGGFGGPPKFPQPWAIELAFHLYARNSEQKWLEMATATLSHMRDGELYDPVEGGFFRYCASDDWENPHYEKLLDLNAQMLGLYLKAYHLTGETAYRTTAKGVLDYILSTLAAEGQPWFYGSQSADRLYYHQPEEDRIWSDAPAVDQTVYTDRNACAVSAFLSAYHVLDDPDCLKRAMDLSEFLWNHCTQDGQGMAHYVHGGRPFLTGHLSDQVYMVSALLDAFEASGLPVYLDQAKRLTGIMDERLWDHEQGGYWDLPEGSERQGLLRHRLKPFVENAVASINLTRLFYLAGGEGYHQRSSGVLCSLSMSFRVYKHQAAPFAVAVGRFMHPPHQITIVGEQDPVRQNGLLKAAHSIKSPWKIVLCLNPERDEERIRSLGYVPSQKSVAYMCVGKTCLPPVSSAQDLIAAARALT